jgi:hypothetical protein
MKPIWKTALGLAAGLAVAGIAGCVVPCLQPLFEAKDAIFEPALLGSWRNAKDSNNNRETFTFTRVEAKNEYRILDRQADGRQATLTAWLGKIGGRQYLCAALDYDALPETGRWFAFPPHLLIFRVEQTAPELKLTMLGFEACKKLLTAKPDAIAHVMLKPTGEKEESAVPILTGSTAELQRFIKDYAESASLFPADTTLTFTRLAKEKPAAAPTAKPLPAAIGG